MLDTHTPMLELVPRRDELGPTALAATLAELGRPAWRAHLAGLEAARLDWLAGELAAEAKMREAVERAADARLERMIQREERRIARGTASELARRRKLARAQADALVALLEVAGANLAALARLCRAFFEARWELEDPALELARARVQVERIERAGAALRDWHARPDARKREHVFALPDPELRHLHAAMQMLQKLDAQPLYKAAGEAYPQYVWIDTLRALDVARDAIPPVIAFRDEIADRAARIAALREAAEAEDSAGGADGSDGQGQAPVDRTLIDK